MPIELLLKEVKNLFGIVDSNFKALMASTLNTRRRPKKWIYIKNVYFNIPAGNPIIKYPFYKNTRKTDIILKSITYDFDSKIAYKLYTESTIIAETFYLQFQNSNSPQVYAEQFYDNLDFLIHPNETVYTDFTVFDNAFRYAKFCLVFAEV